MGDLVEAPPGMARCDHGGVAAVGEALRSELAHGLEQPETTAERAGLDDHHRPVDQVAEEIVDVVDVQGRCRRQSPTIVSAADAIEWAGEDREPPEHRLLGRRQQVVGPLDGGSQRPMTLDAGPPTAGQEPETIVQPLDQFRRREAPGASGGQLDGERDAVEAAADLLDVVAAGARIERRGRRRRPLVEQLHTRSRRVQRCDGDEPLVAQAEALPRGGEHPDVRAALGNGAGQVGGTVDDVLAVVQDEQRSARLQGAPRSTRVNVRPRLSFTFRTPATARGTSLDEPFAASSMSQAPPRMSTSARCATASASRVLPIPPGPTSVTIGEAASASWMVSRSSSRPISRPRRRGRFPPRLASINNGGCSPSPSWTMRCSATTPSRRNVPRSRRSLPSSSADARPDSKVWPP